MHAEKGTVQKIRTLNSSQEMKILLCALLARREEPGTEEALDFLCKIAFRNSVPGAAFKDQGSFATAARTLYARSDAIDMIESATLKEVLESWRKDYDSTPVNLDSVASAFSRLYDYQRGNKGFHRWYWLKYFLFEYEENLVANTKEKNPRVTLDRYSATSIEHVMPQTWQTNWSEEMGDFLGKVTDATFHDDARKTIVNSLGNLTIIGARTNSALQNDAWGGEGGKKQFYAKEGTYSETEISMVEKWNYRSILKRGSELMDLLAEKLCGTKFTLEQKKLALLFRSEIYNCFADADFSYDK